MIEHMKARILSSFAWVVGFMAMTGSALAQESENPVDVRLIGYKKSVVLDASSTATTWLLMIALMIVCVAPLFMNARRSHLD